VIECGMERVNYSPVKKAVAKAPDAGCLTIGASGSVIVNVGPSPSSFVRAAALDADFITRSPPQFGDIGWHLTVS
jgi:hypothetical protein